MQNSNNDNVADSETNVDRLSVSASVPTENINRAPALLQEAVSTNNIEDSVNTHATNEAVYNTNNSYHPSGISYIPPTSFDEKFIKTENGIHTLTYPYMYENKLPQSTNVQPEGYEYNQFDPSTINNNSKMYMDTYKHVDGNWAWTNDYPLVTEQNNGSNVHPVINNLNKTCNINNIQTPQNTVIPPMYRTSPIQLSQPPISYDAFHAQNDMTYYAQQTGAPDINPKMMHHVQPQTQPQPPIEPYVSPQMAPGGVLPNAPRYISCKINPISETNSTFRKPHEQIPRYNIPPINCTPAPYVNKSCLEGVSPSHIQYDHMRHMRPVLHMPPNSPIPYVMTKEKDNQCLLKKGIDCALNGCQPKNNFTYVPKYEYFVRTAKGTPTSTIHPFTSFKDNQKFDMFKNLTLKVGTCLDDLVNVFIESLSSSIQVLHKNNDAKLHDLHPFYNPDPIYTRPERPTLRTGNNIIDNINNALDGSTLEKHKNLPKDNMRIPIPKTEKTGHVVVDGLNNILDNLLNDPMSYQKYDYYSDKVDLENKRKRINTMANR